MDKNYHEVRLSLELYKSNGKYGIYIADNQGGSGITVKEATPEEAVQRAGEYLVDYFKN